MTPTLINLIDIHFDFNIKWIINLQCIKLSICILFTNISLYIILLFII